ncbi:CDP-alcohol phosphatidyltransferase family protein [Palleronia abyssalis]|uniref:Inner membrane protein YnjF n=1 Tax=Palleronia abyssalis TaxID=1501240 RepID=A0A2R8BWT5_9RHOB|nr:CDP-alcohol phosphatidyltransferase family protein [Palleronia abyssalis]SPJ24627.1 Inner membrane protein YnjF [Palleronia abyssalis]
MLDPVVRRFIDPPLDRAGRVLAGWGASADAVTLAGLALGLLSAGLIARGLFDLALAFLLVSRIADGLDGAVARASVKTQFGGMLDIAADFLFYGAIPLAFAVASPSENAVAAAFLLLSFYFNATTFLGFAILAEKRGMDTAAQGEKTLYYSNGLLEGTETIVFFVVLCLLPDYFPTLAYVFGGLCFITATLRLLAARRIFAN